MCQIRWSKVSNSIAELAIDVKHLMANSDSVQNVLSGTREGEWEVLYIGIWWTWPADISSTVWMCAKIKLHWHNQTNSKYHVILENASNTRVIELGNMQQHTSTWKCLIMSDSGYMWVLFIIVRSLKVSHSGLMTYFYSLLHYIQSMCLIISITSPKTKPCQLSNWTMAAWVRVPLPNHLAIKNRHI